jgi:hypothetical protein
LAAISISGMTSRLTDDRLAALGQTVREVAVELTAARGGVMPAAKIRVSGVVEIGCRSIFPHYGRLSPGACDRRR